VSAPDQHLGQRLFLQRWNEHSTRARQERCPRRCSAPRASRAGITAATKKPRQHLLIRLQGQRQEQDRTVVSANCCPCRRELSGPLRPVSATRPVVRPQASGDPMERQAKGEPTGIPQAIYPVVHAGDVRATPGRGRGAESRQTCAAKSWTRMERGVANRFELHTRAEAYPRSRRQSRPGC
jgi:hypothetical protein